MIAVLRPCFVLLVMILTNGIFCQNNVSGESKSDSVVQVLQKIDDPASVVLFRNDNYVISASYAVFSKNFAAWISRNPGLSDDEKLYELLEKAAKSTQLIDAAMIAEKNNLFFRLKYRMADLLQLGQCMIYNKKTLGPIASITVQTYTLKCGTDCTEGGRRFFIDDVMFLSVIDWLK